MKFKLILSFFIFTFIMTNQAQEIKYTVNIENPKSHYANVKIELKGIKDKFVDFKLPVWTPGSYMVREFSRNIEKVNANNLSIKKIDKNTWRVENKGVDIILNYQIYCFEPSVRTSYIDEDHAFFLPSSLLMYADKHLNLKGKVEFKYSSWSTVSTTLKKEANNLYSFNDYDELADSPIEIGNHSEFEFEVAKVKHRVAMVGKNNADITIFKKDLEKICETMFNIIGEHPCKDYLFIIHHVENGGGGLEHANSCVVQMPRFNYSNKDNYTSFLGLCAHEYFHLWNVKRIRPAALGPFDYSKENYTNLLWVAEGITSYYDELALYRAGIWNSENYISALGSMFNAVSNRVGSTKMSLHEASHDAWVKEYRPNENSINSSISYYSKGALVAAILDMEIIKASDGKKNLDDLMKYLYQTYYVAKNIGFTDVEFYDAINKVAGKTIDISYFVNKPNDENWITNCKNTFSKLGITLEENKNNSLYTGIKTEIKNDKLFVKSIVSNSSGEQAGLQFGDELIALNDLRIKTNLEEQIKLVGKGKANLIISRNGLIKTVSIEINQNAPTNYKIVKPEAENVLFNYWLKR